jgi:hypothetical protein
MNVHLVQLEGEIDFIKFAKNTPVALVRMAISHGQIVDAQNHVL